MIKTVRIAAAQTLEYREDIDAAVASMVDFAVRAEAEGARLLCLPEAFLQGYLPTSQRRDALRWTFVRQSSGLSSTVCPRLGR